MDFFGKWVLFQQQIPLAQLELKSMAEMLMFDLHSGVA